MNDLLFPLPLILLGWAIGGGSPGPATLAISGTSMAHGRKTGLLLAAGVVIGSATWGIAAALGFSAIMMSDAWLFNMVRYIGAAYLLYLTGKSLHAAWVGKVATPPQPTRFGAFGKGLTLHLTNPKAVLGWGAVYAAGMTLDAQPMSVALITTSAIVFLGYAVLFSSVPIARGYARLSRWFNAVFGIIFGAASLKLLTTKMSQ